MTTHSLSPSQLLIDFLLRFRKIWPSQSPVGSRPVPRGALSLPTQVEGEGSMVGDALSSLGLAGPETWACVGMSSSSAEWECSFPSPVQPLPAPGAWMRDALLSLPPPYSWPSLYL